MHLRITPPKNGQRAWIQFADDFLLAGAVAQLEERCDGIAEARGSSPLSSTAFDSSDVRQIGANELRDHLGSYMQRAAAGETFNVTRRGKPYVRLSGPAEPRQLDLASG